MATPDAKRKRSGSDEPGVCIVKKRKTACQRCRVRKLKCDTARPSCAICRSTASLCEYTDKEKLTLEAATELICGQIGLLQHSVNSLANQDPHISSLSKALEDTTDLEAQNSVLEPSKDFSNIPAHKTSCDTVLTWGVFDAKYTPLSLVDHLFRPDDDQRPEFNVPGGLISANEERIPALVDSFLQNVHTKNPVLDVESLVQRAREVPFQGLGWDAWSCQLLLACALGSIAKPFDQARPASPPVLPTTDPLALSRKDTRTEDLRHSESYFVLACRRLGTLKPSLLGAQCYFFAGVYLMYTLRPLISWEYFTQASRMYQMYIRVAYGATDVSQLEEIQMQSNLKPSPRQQRLEQCIYWSCFKSECEFRVELPLPQSEIASFHHPQLFPSPPSPASHDDSHAPSPSDPLSTSEHFELRQHAKKLCNEEESWYYYLTEIALRRIGNRIINTFFRDDPSAWLNIGPFLDIALEFDTQVSAWSANLPPAMQDWETSDTIRAPNSMLSNGERNGSHVSRELSWATDNRLLEMRSWLYQPFLYYLIHCRDAATRSFGINGESNVLQQMITSGIECNMKILDVRALRHRHHGLWYDLRSITTAGLILLAVMKSGHVDLIPGGSQALLGERTGQSSESGHIAIGGRIGNALEQLEYWSQECPSLRKHRDVLEQISREVWIGLPAA